MIRLHRGRSETALRPGSAFIRSDRRLYTTFMRRTLQFRLSSVKMLIFGIVASCSIQSNATAQSLKPSKVINLAHVKIAGSECKASFPDGFSNIQWLDDSRLMASTYWAHCDDGTDANTKKFETLAVLFDVRGMVLATVHSHAVMYTKGPHGTIAALQAGAVELLDAQMHSEQAIPCPNSAKTCGISLDQSSGASADFALCSSSDQSEQVCDFYTGWPATKSEQKELPVREDPFARVATNTWQVSSHENWLFKGGYLTRVASDGSNSPVNPTNFAGDNGGNCGGQLSEASPRRFLATCVGAHWYSDGMFDNIFGFSHTVLFDITTGNIIGRVDGGAFIESALSPSGRQIAILKDKKVRLYDAP